MSSHAVEIDFIEDSDRHLVIAKCRSYISDEMMTHFETNSNFMYEDRFYDKLCGELDEITVEDGQNGKFNHERYRNKNGLYVLDRRLTQISQPPYRPNRHYYLQSEVHKEEWKFEESDCFLKIRFQRYALADTEDECNVQCFVDVMDVGGFKYRVLTLSCSLSMSQDRHEHVRDTQTVILPFLNRFSLNYPVFSKFMFALRMSQNFHLYENVFEPHCSSLCSSISRILCDICTAQDQSTADKEYIGTVDYVPHLYESCMSLSLSESEIGVYLATKKKQLVDCQNVRFSMDQF